MISREENIPWNVIPDIIGPQPPPLAVITVALPPSSTEQQAISVQDESLISRLLDLRATGVDLVLPWKAIGRADLIRPSRLPERWPFNFYSFLEGQWDCCV